MIRIEKINIRTNRKFIFSIKKILYVSTIWTFGPAKKQNIFICMHVLEMNHWETLFLVLNQGICRQLYEQIIPRQEMKDLSAEYIPLKFLDET